MDFLKLFAAPVTELVNSVSGVVDKFVTTDAEKLEAQRKMSELQLSFQAKVMDAQAKFAEQQAEVIKSEAASQSWMARNWRPILMLTFTYIIAHNYVISPMFGLAKVDIPENMWALIELGVGGYVGGRTIEKVAPAIAQAVASRPK